MGNLLSRFKGGDLSLSPLKLQLTPDGGNVALVEWRASLQCETGSPHSRPVISRPSIPGTTITKVAAIPVDGFGSSSAFVISQFDTAPSLPSVSTMTYAMPSFISYQWQAGQGGEIIALDGGALLLYALAGPGGSWDGEMVWEDL